MHMQLIERVPAANGSRAGMGRLYYYHNIVNTITTNAIAVVNTTMVI